MIRIRPTRTRAIVAAAIAFVLGSVAAASADSPKVERIADGSNISHLLHVDSFGQMSANDVGSHFRLDTVTEKLDAVNQELDQLTFESGALRVVTSGSSAVTGTVAVSNLPATQNVAGAVAITNLPAVQPVAGTVAVANFPQTLDVNVVGGSLGGGGALVTNSNPMGFGDGLLIGSHASNTFSMSPEAHLITGYTFFCPEPVIITFHNSVTGMYLKFRIHDDRTFHEFAHPVAATHLFGYCDSGSDCNVAFYVVGSDPS